MKNQQILKHYLDYDQIKKEIELVKENLNKSKLQEAKEKYLILKEKIKKFVEEIVFLIEEAFFNIKNKVNKEEQEKIHNFLHNLVFEIFFDKDHYLFPEKVTNYPLGKEITTQYKGEIITIAKILKTKDENFWFLLDDILVEIDTILDIIENKEFLSNYRVVSANREDLKNDIKKLKSKRIKDVQTKRIRELYKL